MACKGVLLEMGKREVAEGCVGVFIPTLSENLSLANGYPETPGICSDTLDLVSDIPDFNPETPGLAGTLSRNHFGVVFVSHKYLYRFS